MRTSVDNLYVDHLTPTPTPNPNPNPKPNLEDVDRVEACSGVGEALTTWEVGAELNGRA